LVGFPPGIGVTPSASVVFRKAAADATYSDISPGQCYDFNDEPLVAV
jgi:hypothetical protein